MALLAAKRGFPEQAAELARLGARVATNPGEKDRFQMMAASLEPAAKPEPDPAQKSADAATKGPYLLKTP